MLNGVNNYKGKPTPIYLNRRPNKEKSQQHTNLPRQKKCRQPVEDESNTKATRKKFQPEMPILNQNWFKGKANCIPTQSENIPVESKLNVVKTTMHLLSERFYQKIGGNMFDSTVRPEERHFDAHSKQSSTALGRSCDSFDRKSFSNNNISPNLKTPSQTSANRPEGKNKVISIKFSLTDREMVCNKEKNTPSVLNDYMSAIPTKSTQNC